MAYQPDYSVYRQNSPRPLYASQPYPAGPSTSRIVDSRPSSGYYSNAVNSNHTPTHSPSRTYQYALNSSQSPDYSQGRQYGGYGGDGSPRQEAVAGPSRTGNKGRDYLLGLQSSLSTLNIDPDRQTYDKPLPQLPHSANYSSGSTASPPQPSRAFQHAQQPQHAYPNTYTPPTPPRAAFTAPPLPRPPAIPPRLYHAPEPPRPVFEPAIPVLPRPAQPAKPSPHQPKSFAPSFHPHASPDTGLLVPPVPTRPHSDNDFHRSSRKGTKTTVIDLTGAALSDADWKDEDVDSDSDDVWNPTVTVTDRSPARRRRTKPARPTSTSPSPSPSSSQPQSGAKRPNSKQNSSTSAHTPTKTKPPRSSSASPSNAVRCAGYTLAGAPCKRLIKAQAPYLHARDTNLPSDGGPDDGADGMEQLGRYCHLHVERICKNKGFYSRRSGNPDIWIDFDEFIPPTLDEQTQALLRTTMDSKLTDKESPGFLYVYELRDLQTESISFFKVGRTENVPRRISQWTSQCQSHTPTLRDIFPRRDPPSRVHNPLITQHDLQRQSTGSFLPGAFHSASSSDTTRPRIPAMKRWERLVHLELSDISSRLCAEAWSTVREKCQDCGTVHREIFPVPRRPNGEDLRDDVIGQEAYDLVVELPFYFIIPTIMIVITGANGKLGRQVLDHLLPLVPASTLGVSVRDPSKLKLADQTIRVRRGDYTDVPSLKHAFEGADQLLLVSVNVLGEEAVSQHKRAIDIAKEVGVKTIFYTSHVAASPTSTFAPMPDHYATEQYLEQSGLDFVSLRNGFHMDTVLRLLGNAPESGKIVSPKDGKVSWTAHSDLGEGIAKIIASYASSESKSTPKEKERYINLTNSEALDLADIAKIYTEVKGKPTEHVELDWQTYREGLVSHGVPAHYVDLFKGMFEAAAKGEMSKVDGRLEELLGRKAKSVREILEEGK